MRIALFIFLMCMPQWARSENADKREPFIQEQATHGSYSFSGPLNTEGVKKKQREKEIELDSNSQAKNRKPAGSTSVKE